MIRSAAGSSRPGGGEYLALGREIRSRRPANKWTAPLMPLVMLLMAAGRKLGQSMGRPSASRLEPTTFSAQMIQTAPPHSLSAKCQDHHLISVSGRLNQSGRRDLSIGRVDLRSGKFVLCFVGGWLVIYN